MSEYAIEADPGRLTASHPLYSTYEAARWSADGQWAYRQGLPAPRVLVRINGEWSAADVE